jgi:RHS repeat-associated protein
MVVRTKCFVHNEQSEQMNNTFLNRILILLIVGCVGTLDVHAQLMWDIKPANNQYHFSHTQTPDNLVPVIPAVAGSEYEYYWGYDPVNVSTSLGVTTSATLSFTGPLDKTRYYRRRMRFGGADFYSNVIKIEVVSVGWENLNYVREHHLRIAGQSDWKAIDNLPIGNKIQTTTYYDGIGREVQTVGKELGTPDAATPTVWRDLVSYSRYDVYGREDKMHIPFTSVSQPGKFKPAAATEQPQYFTTNYNESSPFHQATFDNSPLDRVKNVKRGGTAYAAGTGTTIDYQLNDLTDDVQIFNIGFASGDAPVRIGAYAANTLFKTIYTDERGKKVIEYSNNSGQIILKKVQIDDVPGASYAGWACTYNVYDDFGLLRCTMTPEAVQFLQPNNWSFTATNGPTVLNEQCFRYEYDDKGRMISKKSPGSLPLFMIYDQRDRLVFTQDGNQRAKSPGEWTATLYDELDRPILTTLYRTTKTIAALQTDLANAAVTSSITLTNPATPLTHLIVDNRQAGVTVYNAQTSIEFIDGFESGATDDFTAEINATTQNGSTTVTTTAYKSPISAADLNNATVNTILKYFFYDNYAFNGASSFSTSFDNLQAHPVGGEAIASSTRTLSMATGSKVRVLGTNQFLTNTFHYDDKGRAIQSHEQNIKSGIDVTTLQYMFDGSLISSNTRHTAANSEYYKFSIITKNIYDKIGRISTVEKKFGTNAFESVASYEYDDIGRLKKKKLDPGYTGTGLTELESLAYSYNLHNELTGINKDFALKTVGKYNKWGNFFGQYIGFDNRDGVFAAAQLGGLVTGVLWNTQGEDVQRKYDYVYDNAGRLANANYNEKQLPGDAWSNAKMNFSVTGSGGKLTYTLNGNLLSMLHKGVVPGSNTPLNVDDLTYTYNAYSNKLLKVVDASTLATNNGKLGDFTDGANGTANDYVYDNNGNLVIDLNKNAKDLANVVGANGVRYNHLDKPEEIRIAGKGSIKLVYDADGSRLQRTFTPEGAGTASTTSYINAYVYKDDNLEFINFEEGRLRVVQAVNQNNGYDALTIDGNINLPGNKRGAYDYYILDYQHNVRMILTEQVHTGSNACTMETARAANEERVFGKVDASGNPTTGNEVQARFAVSSIPGQSSGGGWQNSAIGNHVSRIGNLAGSKVGPNTLLKVMAGDQVSATTLYYYQNAVTNTNTASTLANALLVSLGQAIAGGPSTSGVVKGSSSNITSLLNTSTPFTNAIAPDATNPNGTAPKAYLSVMFFDERFNFIQEGSATVRVSQAGSGAPALVLTNIKAPKNGYAYVYVSNESDEMVYFDNVQVSHNRGRIIEENHYYAFGLRIAGISARKLSDPNEGRTANNYLYQGEFAELDDDMGWTDFMLRSYDQQIGRFVQADPFDQFASGYVGMGNDPVNLIDPSGGIACPGTSALAIFFENVGQFISNAASTVSNLSPWISGSAQLLNTGMMIGNMKVDFQLTQRSLVSNLTTQVGMSAANPCDDCPTGWMAKPKTLEEVTVRSKPKKSGFWGKLLDGVQVVLDIGGLVPGFGEVADGINGLIYLARGDKANAALSFAAMVPVAGNAATGAKYARKIFNAGKRVKKAKKAAEEARKHYNDLVKAAQKEYPELAGKTQLHHPIPQYLGGPKKQTLVPLDAAYHQKITNEFRRLHPYGSPAPSPERMAEIMNEVYSKFPLPGP